MFLHFLKAKIHRATVTDANLHYKGSITIDKVLMKAAGIRPFERVEIYNISNGERFATYAIEGNEGMICLNGAAAWKVKVKDKVIIAAYCHLDADEAARHQPNLVYVDEQNRLVSVAHEVPLEHR